MFTIVSLTLFLFLLSLFRVRKPYKLSKETVKYSPVSCSDQVRTVRVLPIFFFNFTLCSYFLLRLSPKMRRPLGEEQHGEEEEEEEEEEEVEGTMQPPVMLLPPNGAWHNVWSLGIFGSL